MAQGHTYWAPSVHKTHYTIIMICVTAISLLFPWRNSHSFSVSISLHWSLSSRIVFQVSFLLKLFSSSFSFLSIHFYFTLFVFLDILTMLLPPSLLLSFHITSEFVIIFSSGVNFYQLLKKCILSLSNIPLFISNWIVGIQKCVKQSRVASSHIKNESVY